MNIYELASNLINVDEKEELDNAIFSLSTNRLVEFYKVYNKIMQNMIFVTSQDELFDFLNDVKLNINVFILEFLASKNYCIQIGVYENNIEEKIFKFFDRKKINLSNDFRLKYNNIHTDLDGDDNFDDYLLKLDKELSYLNLNEVVLFNDVYCSGIYTLFIFYEHKLCEIFKNLEEDDISIYKI